MREVGVFPAYTRASDDRMDPHWSLQSAEQREAATMWTNNLAVPREWCGDHRVAFKGAYYMFFHLGLIAYSPCQSIIHYHGIIIQSMPCYGIVSSTLSLPYPSTLSLSSIMASYHPLRIHPCYACNGIIYSIHAYHPCMPWIRWHCTIHSKHAVAH